MSAPLISVLIPTAGRRPEWLDVARKSVASQYGVPGDVECIVEYDFDGTDQSATLNRAFARSRGRWVTVCHDDDFYVRADALALLHSKARLSPKAAIYSLPLYVDTDGRPGPTPTRNIEWMRHHPVVTWGSFPDGLYLHGTGVLYPRSWWESVGGWDESLPCAEEYEFHLRLLSRGCTFIALAVPLMAYRFHPGQKSARRTGAVGRTSARQRAVMRELRKRYATLAPAPAQEVGSP